MPGNCQNGPKNPINRFSTSWESPKGGKHKLSIHCDSHNRGKFCSPQGLQVVLLLKPS